MRKSCKVLGLGGPILDSTILFFGLISANPEVQVMKNLTSIPLAFTENLGQWEGLI